MKKNKELLREVPSKIYGSNFIMERNKNIFRIGNNFEYHHREMGLMSGFFRFKIRIKGICNQKKFACFVIEVLLSFIIFCHHKKLLTFRVSTCQVCKIRLFIFCSMPFHNRKPKKNKWREEKEKSHLASPHTIG